MSAVQPDIIELREFERQDFAREAIPYEVGEALWRNYRRQVDVEFPGPPTDNQWRLKAQGWVGQIPVSEGLRIALKPKVPVENLFRMLEYAYNLKSFHILEGEIDSQTLEDLYERLANILARRVLDRGSKGFHRSYVAETDRLPYLRGRMDVQQAIRRPWDVALLCHYEDHTADIEDNQILAWTLRRIARSGICTERVLPTVRKAYRALQGFVTPASFGPEACIGRLYNRLNEDYSPMHALCRFFLEQSGPTWEVGDHTMLPFLVDMARLYERFVAEWLGEHLPPTLRLKAQERYDIGQDRQLHFSIDLVLYDAAAGRTRCVLDTKYKDAREPATADISQVVAYAEAKHCQEAILIYPVRLDLPLDTSIGNIQVKTLTFALDGDLEQAGQAFLHELLEI